MRQVQNINEFYGILYRDTRISDQGWADRKC